MLSVGNYLARLITSWTQELHGTHALNGYHQQRLKRQATAIHRPRETGLNPHDRSGASHKTNHDLEEQLRQRDAGHNVQEDNQEDSSERGEPERPEDSNAPSKPERQNLSLSSLMDVGNEGTNGGHDERPQGMNVQRP